jgi:hypothetical protein
MAALAGVLSARKKSFWTDKNRSMINFAKRKLIMASEDTGTIEGGRNVQQENVPL